MPEMDLPERNRLPRLEDAQSVSLSCNDVTLGGYFFEAPGTGRAVLVLHGWGEDAGVHVPAARHFQRAGYHTLTLSMRGWRGSSGRDDYGLKQVQDTVCALGWLEKRTQAKNLFLYGFSQGGLVALLASATGADVAGVATLNAPTELKSFYKSTSFSGVRRYLDTVCKDGLWDERSPLYKAANVRAPVLLLASEADTFVPPEQSSNLHKQLPNSRLQLLPQMGHVLEEDQAQDVWNKIISFFNSR